MPTATRSIGSRRKAARRQSFSLVESLLAIAVAAMAGSAVLAGVYAAVHSAELSIRQAVALAIAEQWLDEIYGSRYSEGELAPYTLALGPEFQERAGSTRAAYDDLDDYHGLVCQPPTDRWGVRIGRDDGAGTSRWEALAVNWPLLDAVRVECSVSYARKDDFRRPVSAGSVSDYRAIEVTVSFRQPDGTFVPVGRLRRIAAYLPRL